MNSLFRKTIIEPDFSVFVPPLKGGGPKAFHQEGAIIWADYGADAYPRSGINALEEARLTLRTYGRATE